VKRFLRGVGAFLLVSALLVAAAAWWLGSQLVAPANHAVGRPDGFDARSVSIPGTGHLIAGWWVAAGSAAPVVLLLHGARADRLAMVGRAQLLSERGFSVLLIDLQAHGETPGETITLGSKESADVVAALSWIRAQRPGCKIGVVGVSLGGASVLLAPQPLGVDAVVLETVYPRIARAAENRVRIRLGPLAPFLTPLLLWQLQPRLGISAEQLEPIRSIATLGAPVLVVAGSADQHTTLAESRELFEAAAEPKRLWIVEGARHQDFMSFDRTGYEEQVLGFLQEQLEAPAAQSPPAARGKGGRE
jgi:alpha-beta hydrolase superfamily lysophospholipase